MKNSLYYSHNFSLSLKLFWLLKIVITLKIIIIIIIIINETNKHCGLPQWLSGKEICLPM